jgi:hypothetical protein
VGWQAIEIYPRLSEEYWRPEYAAAWARLDLMSVIAQRNFVDNALLRLDGRRAAREKYARLLEQLGTLLTQSAATGQKSGSRVDDGDLI